MRHLSVIALVLAVSIAGAASVSQTLTFSPADLKLGTQDGYTTVNFAGAPHVELLGAPKLPVMPAQVVIPPSAEVTSLEIAELHEQPVAGSYRVLPVQYPQAWSYEQREFPFVEPRAAYYGAAAKFPVSAAEFTDVGDKSGYRLASFRVYPVRYNPVTQQLSVVTSVTVKVNYVTGKHHVARRSEMQIARNGDAVRSLVLNPQSVATWAPPLKTHSYASALLPAGTYEHIILTSHQYVDSLKPLRDWRTRQGWRSRIVEIESVAAVYPGVDTAEKMRNFLKDAETTWSTLFCFIARKDFPSLQFRRAYVNVDGYGVDYLPSDFYFSCLDGSWNADGDGVWGEPNDSADAWTDISVGMITLDGFSELSKYLSKVFRYEFTPDTGWFKKTLLGDDVTFSMNLADSIANATPAGWFDLKMYASGGMVSPSVAGYCDSLNHGYPITSVISHGAVDVYGMGGDITSPIMNALTNTNRLSMFTGVCCHTGAWDEAGNTNGDCIAENMAFHAPNGFIGVDMNTRYGWVEVAEYFNYSICYGAVGFRTPRRITQGEALAYGLDYWHGLVAVTTDTSKFRWEAYERTLFGEPAVPLWTDRAFNVSVTKPGAINIGGGVPVDITVNSADGPVDSAMVCLMKGEETYARGFTDAAGTVTLNVSPLTPGMLQLTVSCANNIPYLDSIVVMASGKYVSYLRSSISDPAPDGNGDGIINPGESFRLPTWVKNYGTQAANTVTGRLITHTSGATITDSIKSFGSIAGGDSAENAQGFAMTVASGLPNGYAIPCSLVCRDAQDSVWVSFLTLHVGAPVLTFVDKTVRDSAGAQPNGKLDPGETADLVVTIANGGIGNAYNVHAVLRSGDARLTVPDSAADFGAIAHGTNGTNDADHFTITASASIPMETPVSCTLDIYADAGYVGQATFTLVVGEIRGVDPVPDGPRQPALYWAYDDVDAGYDEHPAYNWVEIAGVGTQLSLTDDQTVVVSLPSGFGPYRFYNQDYTQISICGNGWVGMGSTTLSTYSETAIPTSEMPPAYFLHWDDMYPPSGNGVWYYHDAANHRFIVEYDSVPLYSSQTDYQKFELVMYDTTMAADDGNCEATIQYQIADNPGSCTVGEQDPTMAIAIQCLFDGAYNRGCVPIGAGRAIKFTTNQPLTAVTEPAAGTSVMRHAVEVFPNPFAGTASIRWQLAAEGRADLKVYDASGRVVRTLARGTHSAGAYTALWNGTDDAGRKVSRGVYFVRLATPTRTTNVKTILTK